MPLSEDQSYFQEWEIDLPVSSMKANVWMEEYLGQSNYRLNSIAERFNRGEKIDVESRDWMLNQVDFIVDSLGADSGEFDDSLRSRLLQLILGIAKLNEKIRNQMQVSLERV